MEFLAKIVRPVLSSEAWEAEYQIDFLIFWIPSFFIVALCDFCIIRALKKHKVNKDKK
jgi:hypothetical protein